MSIYSLSSAADLLRGNAYPGRGIIIGSTADGTKAAVAYFIMGRSQNSRNRIFVEKDGAVFTEPFDASNVQDPSLIIYAALRSYENHLIVTNGDQTDTVFEGLRAGKTFSEALEARSFEPDAPNFTPRISGMLTFADGDFTYQMSILKSIDETGSACARYTFAYPSKAGLGHFLHTYVGDGSPLPTFQGEPERAAVPNDLDQWTEEIWNALDQDNRISLYTRMITLSDGAQESRLVNRWQ